MANKARRLTVDPQIAAELEVAWWHAHRQQQHDAQSDEDALVASLIRLYCYLYQAGPDDVRRAAELRVEAMALSDAWVVAGCHLADPTLARERLALVASFTALREAAIARSCEPCSRSAAGASEGLSTDSLGEVTRCPLNRSG